MQAIKDKLHDMNEMRKVKAEVKKEEKAEKELAKARVEVAKEVRMAREAEAAMDLHVTRAAEVAAEHERKHPHPTNDGAAHQDTNLQPNSYAGNSTATPSEPVFYDSNSENMAAYDSGTTGGTDPTASAAGMDYSSSRAGGAPSNNNLL